MHPTCKPLSLLLDEDYTVIYIMKAPRHPEKFFHICLLFKYMPYVIENCSKYDVEP